MNARVAAKRIAKKVAHKTGLAKNQRKGQLGKKMKVPPGVRGFRVSAEELNKLKRSGLAYAGAIGTRNRPYVFVDRRGNNPQPTRPSRKTNAKRRPAPAFG